MPIGVCRALGATATDVVRMILGWTLRGVAIGAGGALLLLAVLAAVFGARVRGALNGLHPLDLSSFALGSSILILAIAAAIYLPARRALGAAPVEALRGDS